MEWPNYYMIFVIPISWSTTDFSYFFIFQWICINLKQSAQTIKTFTYALVYCMLLIFFDFYICYILVGRMPTSIYLFCTRWKPIPWNIVLIIYFWFSLTPPSHYWLFNSVPPLQSLHIAGFLQLHSYFRHISTPPPSPLVMTCVLTNH